MSTAIIWTISGFVAWGMFTLVCKLRSLLNCYGAYDYEYRTIDSHRLWTYRLRAGERHQQSA